jgi:spoIIIJ-associated protein
MKKSKKPNKVDLTQELAEELLTLMGTKPKIKVAEDKENEALVVNIETEDEAGLLIGHRGETLNALQSLLGMMIRQKYGDWVRVLVNVGDWREKQEEYLARIALDAAERAKQTGEPQPLYNLSAGQRRIIHVSLADDPKIETESVGEGEERYLLVKPK